MPISEREKFMRLALKLAKKGRGQTRSNPMVGCVLVKNGRIIATGYHAKFGGAHAEVIALRKAGGRAKGATAYLTLEPCVSFPGKKTGPCSERLIAAGVCRVVIAMLDPNPKVCGKGIALLKKNGVAVEIGLLEREASKLNYPNGAHAPAKKPLVTLKVAMSLDGYIAKMGKIAPRGKKYFSSPASLRFAHELRASCDAILVGVGTVLADDPALTTRLARGRDPLRVILDPELQIPFGANVLNDPNVLIVCANSHFSPSKKKRLEGLGFGVLSLKNKKGRIGWGLLLRELGSRGICSLLIEGGSHVISSALNEGAIDRAYFIIAPRIFGGGVPLLGDPVRSNRRIGAMSFRKLGADILIKTVFA
ncbi:MAG: bifunctional diaminohydroxyphosphoribosylaminopyrimidine deaminase/5-amino-6-(5-phosphoribosylamino)uracil reductase RibD [Candidatus Micrarchaeota archaeon]